MPTLTWSSIAISNTPTFWSRATGVPLRHRYKSGAPPEAEMVNVALAPSATVVLAGSIRTARHYDVDAHGHFVPADDHMAMVDCGQQDSNREESH
jgi:hypothetical protein